MRTIEELKLVPVWVNSGHLVATAKHVMAGHGLRALGVADDGLFVGVVTKDRLATAPESKTVRDVMDSAAVSLSGKTSIRRAAELIADQDLDYAGVVDGDEYIGLLTPHLLIRELGRSWDPLTSLSWSDSLREWGIENLKSGREVAIIFIDLDDFGQFNKLYGHIVGDRVLRRCSRLLQEQLNPATDVLVRYGGDEFAIGTLRTGEAAQEYANGIQQEVSGFMLEDLDVAVTFSVGTAGGHRTKERDKTHFAATLDSLINLASRDCLMKKAKNELRIEASDPQEAKQAAAPKFAVAPVPPRPADRLASLLLVSADDQNPNSPTAVTLSVRGTIITEVHVRGAKPLVESVVLATARCLERGLEPCTITVDEIELMDGPQHGKVIMVHARLKTPEGEFPVQGVRQADRDLFAAAADALIDAVSSPRTRFGTG